MKIDYILQDTTTRKYYSGSGYNLIWSSDIDDAELFDDMDEIQKTLNIEYLNESFEERQMVVLQVLTGKNYNDIVY